MGSDQLSFPSFQRIVREIPGTRFFFAETAKNTSELITGLLFELKKCTKLH